MCIGAYYVTDPRLGVRGGLLRYYYVIFFYKDKQGNPGL